MELRHVCSSLEQQQLLFYGVEVRICSHVSCARLLASALDTLCVNVKTGTTQEQSARARVRLSRMGRRRAKRRLGVTV